MTSTWFVLPFKNKMAIFFSAIQWQYLNFSSVTVIHSVVGRGTTKCNKEGGGLHKRHWQSQGSSVLGRCPAWLLSRPIHSRSEGVGGETATRPKVVFIHLYVSLTSRPPPQWQAHTKNCNLRNVLMLYVLQFYAVPVQLSLFIASAFSSLAYAKRALFAPSSYSALTNCVSEVTEVFDTPEKHTKEIRI